AVLETARGGLMRRGLAVTGADAAIVTNVSDDHLGEWGIDDLLATAEAKLVVARGLRPDGVLVVNAGCAPLAEVAAPLQPLWFGYDPGPGRVAFHHGGWIVLDGQPLVRVDEVPITFGGAARFNVENAIGAALLAHVMGVNRVAIARALRAFQPTPEDNAGRMNVLDVGGVTAVVDFAHNPDGIRQIGPVVRGLPARRRAIVLGQAGDRRDEDVLALVDAVVELGFDHVILKELPEHRRGRAVGEMPAILRRRLVERAFPEAEIEEVDDELPAVDRALAWAAPGDLVLLLTHERYDDVIRRLRG
ncbi:MAG TPA: cyanophycin synthetase, partial [Myxococcota bacterium]|nr:cyanophycin synthetase [Myxococcota bacterium]